MSTVRKYTDDQLINQSLTVEKAHYILSSKRTDIGIEISSLDGERTMILEPVQENAPDAYEMTLASYCFMASQLGWQMVGISL